MAGGLGFPSGASGHGIKQCKHGVVIAQCKCGENNVIIVPCTNRCEENDNGE